MAENLEEMNVARAIEIIKSGETGLRFERAVQFLQLHSPENPILKALDEKEQEKPAPKPAEDKPAPEPVEDETSKKIAQQVKDALEAMGKDKNERDILIEENQEGEEKQELKEDAKVAENLNGIADIYADEEFKKHLRLIMNRDTSNIRVSESGDILGEGKDKTPERIDEDNQLRKAILNEALEAAKHEVLMFYGRDEKFAQNNEADKRKILEDGVAEVFNFKMAKAVAASAVKKPTAEEALPNTKENANYNKQALADMRAALEAFYNKKPVIVKPEDILDSTVNTSQAMDEYETNLRKVNLNKSAQVFNEKKEKYNEARRSFWGVAFDMAKGVWQGIKQNKARIITDAAVVAGAGLAATVAPIAAAAGMGAYFAAGSFAWLVNDERRNQKAKAEDKSAWSGLKGMRNAWNSIMSDKKKKDKFIRQGTITATAGIAGAALFGAAASTMGVVYGRIASGAARSVGSVASQGANWAVASKEYKKNATAENKAARDSARTGFYTSAVASVLGNAVSVALGLSNAADANAAEQTGVVNGADGADGVDTTNTVTKGAVNTGAENAGGQGAENTGTVVEPTPAPEPVEVPTEWNADMGISEKHWNEMMNKITGVYKEHADIFGKENVDPQKAFGNMYQNVENARSAGYFEGQTNEEVLYKYMKLIEQTERVKSVNGYLVTRVDANGEPMYHVNAEEMKALNKIIICNEKVGISADKLNDTLALINKNGKYTGEGADAIITNNRYVGGRYDCNEYQNAWAKGSFAHKHPHIHHQPTPKVPVNEQPAPEPVKVEETVIDNNKQPEPAPRVDETTINENKEKVISWQERKYTTGDNTIASGTGSKPEKVVAEGKVAESVARAAMRATGHEI